MSTYLIAYAATVVVFLGLDAVWLGTVATSFYTGRLGHLMTANVNFPVAAGFYCLYVIGIVIFAVAPALEAGGWPRALWLGALFGFFAYATYDFTNQATLRDWPVVVTVVDMAWGTGLTAVSAAAGTAITRALT